MQFSPNIYNKYASALRIYLQKKILKRGIDTKIKKQLRKIILFELIVCQKIPIPTEIHYFFDKLCCAFSVELLKRHKWSAITLNGNALGIIKRDALIYLLICCKDSKYININVRKNYIKITTDKFHNDVYGEKICMANNYTVIKDLSQNKYGIFIPFKECENSVKKSPDEYDYLLDRLSTLRVLFENQ